MRTLNKVLAYKAGAFDLDGTLLHGSDISPENVLAVQWLTALGLTNLIATGRVFHHALRYHRQLGLAGPMVSSDGACVSIPGGAIILEQPLPLDVSPAIIDLAAASGVSCLCFYRHGICVTSKFDWNVNMDRHREIGSHYREGSIARMRKRPIYKTLLFATDPKRLDALQSAVQESYGKVVDAIRNSPHTLELLATGVSKVSGLAKVAEYLGLEANQFVAFGDGNNDLGMFRWAGLGVCMHHGSPLALETAGEIGMIAPATAPEVNLSAAVARVIERAQSGGKA